MADPRLQWRQLSQAQPNTAGFIREMRGGINDAVSAAEGILGRYQEGQETAGDQELARLLASATNQEELNALVNSDKVQGLRLSSEGIGMLNAAQGNRVNWANTRSIMDDRAGRLSIAQDANTRAEEQFGWARDEYNWDQAQQTWLQDNASTFFDAERRALTGGTSNNLFSTLIDRTESGGADDQYDTLFGYRNRNNGVRVSEMTIGEAGQFASPSGEYGQSVNAEIGRVATPMGKFQIVGTTLRGLQRDLELPDNVPFSPQVQEQLGLFLAQRRIEGRDQQAARNGLRAEWEGFKNVSDAELDAMIDEIRQMPTVTRDSVLAAANNSPTISRQPATLQRPTSQTTQTGFGGDDFTAAMAASRKFTPHEILNQVDSLRSAATRGDSLIAKEDAAFTADVVAGITQDVVSADNFQPGDLASAQTLIQKALEATNKYSTHEAASLASHAVQQIKNDVALNAEFNRGAPTNVQSAIINEAVNNAINQSKNNFRGQDQYRALMDIEKYTEDPTSNLEEDLGIGSDGETRDGYDSNVLRNYINKLADEYKVEPAVMAVAMRDAFIRDPGRGGFPGDWTRNTIVNRFDKDKIAETIKQLTPERRAEFDRARSELKINEILLRQNAIAQAQIQARLNRMAKDNPQRKSLENRLNVLIREAANYSRGFTSLEGR